MAFLTGDGSRGGDDILGRAWVLYSTLLIKYTKFLCMVREMFALYANGTIEDKMIYIVGACTRR